MFSWYTNLRIKTKVLIGIIVILIINLAIIGVSFSQLKSIENSFLQILDKDVAVANSVRDLSETFQDMNIYILRFTVFKQPQYADSYTTASNKCQEIYKDLNKNVIDVNIKKVSGEVQQQADITINEGFGYFEKAKEGDTAGAQAALVKLSQAKAILDGKIQQLLTMEQKYVIQNKTALTKQIDKNIIKIIILSLVLSFFSIGILYAMTKIVTGSIKHLSGLMDNIGRGDLAVMKHVIKVNGDSTDEIKSMLFKLKGTSISLENVIKNIKESSSHVYNSSQRLAKATEESGATMEEVASSVTSISKDMMKNVNIIQETTSSVGEVSTSADMVAQSCQAVASTSRKVREDAISGGSSVKQVLVAVNEVANSSKEVEAVIDELSVLSQKIGEIIEIITGISTQTNLLSLNAAIEAARAGEAGRGFAVVAEEIRKLAAESNDAAKDITNLVVEVQEKTQNAVDKISTSEQKVSEGVKKATDTDDYIQGIVKAIDDVANQVDKISSAALQQSELAKQMSHSMKNILNITETTADSSQQMSAGIEEQTSIFQEIGYVAMQLSKMAEQLNEIVDQFKVE